MTLQGVFFGISEQTGKIVKILTSPQSFPNDIYKASAENPVGLE